MCDPVSLAIIGAGSMGGGSIASFYGERQGLRAMEDANDNESANQKRLRDDNMVSALDGATKSAPTGVAAGASTAAPQDTAGIAKALSAGLPGSVTTAGDARFAGDVGRSAVTTSRAVDNAGNAQDLRRVFGLAQNDADRAVMTANNRIGANNDEAAYALSLFPKHLQAAAGQGRGYRMLGSILQSLGKTGLTQGIGGMGGMGAGVTGVGGGVGGMNSTQNISTGK